ncbi:hypothetical protein BDV96DRAFT_601592 [Lophiotrema nucula]|uniref:RING-type domain-containing protein n=1 Tax=Lophiotrema nucula TaxID=690887 RepID=A0A6A5Z1X4_9PLEO|nr:hypothetical protein BDV96DRAFT_601592 [Lophiotrema nucula]
MFVDPMQAYSHDRSIAPMDSASKLIVPLALRYIAATPHMDYPSSDNPFFGDDVSVMNHDPRMDLSGTDIAFFEEIRAQQQELASICDLCGNAYDSTSSNHHPVQLRCGHVFGYSCFVRWSAEVPNCALCGSEHGDEHCGLPIVEVDEQDNVPAGQMVQSTSFENKLSSVPGPGLLQGEILHESCVAALLRPKSFLHVQTPQDFGIFTKRFDQNTQAASRALEELQRGGAAQQQSLDDAMTGLSISMGEEVRQEGGVEGAGYL